MEVEWHTEEIHRYRASHIFEDIESDETGLILRYRVKSKDFVRAGEAASKIKRALERLGAHPRIVRRWRWPPTRPRRTWLFTVSAAR